MKKFKELIEDYNKLSEEYKRLGKEINEQNIRNLLVEIRESGRYIYKLEERSIILNKAGELAEIIFEISPGEYPSIRLESPEIPFETEQENHSVPVTVNEINPLPYRKLFYLFSILLFLCLSGIFIYFYIQIDNAKRNISGTWVMKDNEYQTWDIVQKSDDLIIDVETAQGLKIKGYGKYFYDTGDFNFSLKEPLTTGDFSELKGKEGKINFFGNKIKGKWDNILYSDFTLEKR